MEIYQSLIPHSELETTLLNLNYCDRTKYIQLYTKIYQFCILISSNQNLNENEINELIINEYVKFEATLLDILSKKSKLFDKNNILRNIADYWNDYAIKIKIINNICEYYNKNFICRLNDYNSVYFEYLSLGYLCFNKIILKNFDASIMNTINAIITKTRDSNIIDHTDLSLVNDISNIINLCEIKNYELEELISSKKLEKNILDISELYYSQKSNDLINKVDIMDYIDASKKWIDFDNKFISKLSISDINKKIIKTIHEDVLILSKNTFINNAINKYICDFNTKNLNVIFNFIKNHIIYINHFTIKIVEKIKTYQDEIKKIDNYEDYYHFILDKYKLFSQPDFYTNLVISKNIDDELKKLINQNKNAPQYLAKYFDSIIKKCTDINDEKYIIDILAYIEDKDIFIKYYQMFLAKRLLLKYNDYELNYVSKMSMILGNETYKLKNQISDIINSKELSTESNIKKINFMVLSSGTWNFKQHAVIFPIEIKTELDKFENFYNQKFNGRKLTWISQSYGQLETNHFKRKYILNVSYVQSVILLEYNRKLNLNTKYLSTEYNINKEIVQLNFDYLLNFGIIKQDSEGNYFINEGFKKDKVKINLMSNLKKKSDNSKKIEKEDKNLGVVEDRKYLVDASIVRIMKSSKRLNINDVITKTVELCSCKFKPNIII